MSRSTDPDHFFQTDSSLSESARKKVKATNDSGNPLRLTSKLLAAVADPEDAGRIYVAEATGAVRRVVIEVCMKCRPRNPLRQDVNHLLAA